MNALDKKLIETECIRNGNWVKLISILKHQFNEWAMLRLSASGYADFKMVYMPLLMNITPEGINNNELASHARVTKQAMSKVAKELQNLGYIKAKIDPRDKRSMIIMLTDRGKKLVVDARLRVMELTDQYRSLIGDAEFERATEVIRKVMDYNDSQLLNRK
jgi:DNA-binding MarR family transcriptional regulator